MDTPTRRRDLLKYAVGAALASTLPVSCCQSPTDGYCKPLAVDLTGPMAFILGTGVVEIMLPMLSDPHKHLGAIYTSAGSISLDGNDYSISFESPPTPPPHAPEIYKPNPYCTVYSEPADRTKFDKKKECIRLTLPMPNNIVALSGVNAWIYTPSDMGTQPDCTTKKPPCTLYALGLRFLYKRAGTPTLTPHGGLAQTIPLGVAPFENQVIMSISFLPLNQPDDDYDHHARATFKELASLVGFSRAIEIESKECHCTKKNPPDKAEEFRGTPQHPCKSPIMLLKES